MKRLLSSFFLFTILAGAVVIGGCYGEPYADKKQETESEQKE